MRQKKVSKGEYMNRRISYHRQVGPNGTLIRERLVVYDMPVHHAELVVSQCIDLLIDGWKRQVVTRSINQIATMRKARKVSDVGFIDVIQCLSIYVDREFVISTG
jgi:hypothetical protein